MRGLLWSFGMVCLLSYAGAQAFTYQGMLKEGSAPANGAYDFEFRLFTAALGGSQVGSTVSVNDLSVQQGLFTVSLNFGAIGATWTGADRFLEIRVRPGASTGAFTTLSPRVKINPTPYSFYSSQALWRGLLDVPAGFADGIDNDTTYTAGAGLQLSGTTFSIATNGVTNGMLASDAASLSKVSGGLMHSTGARIGVGTNSPLAAFQIDAAAGNDVFRARAGTITRLIVLEDGKVGIGGSSPAARLQVDADSTSGEDILRLRSASTTRVVVSNEGRVGIGVGSGTPDAQLIVDGAFNVAPFRVRTEDSAGTATTRLIVTAAGNVGIGTTAPDQKLVVNGTAKVDVLQIVGADVAEKFPVLGEIAPGMVVEIDPDHPGHLRKARGAYNTRVVGVVSGANNLPPGAILGHLEGSENHTPIAMSGRVWVYADATQCAIEPGDLLTTADKPGYAMKARDLRQSHGAILGKAMTHLEKGKTGMVLVVVNLQ